MRIRIVINDCKMTREFDYVTSDISVIEYADLHHDAVTLLRTEE